MSAPSSPTSPRRPRISSVSNASIHSAAHSFRSIMNSDPPLGMWAATAEATSQAPTLGEIRRGSFDQAGWNEEPQRHERSERRRSSVSSGPPVDGRRPSVGRRGSSGVALRRSSTGMSGQTDGIAEEPDKRDAFATLEEEPNAGAKHDGREPFPALSDKKIGLGGSSAGGRPTKDQDLRIERKDNGKKLPLINHEIVANEEGEYPNGYIVPPKKPWTEATLIGLKAFLKWSCTPLGFLIVLYGCNVVAWGGMLFLLLCGAAPAMCEQNTPANHFDGCNDINAPRRVWIEIDSQILNALFCVTGFGLIPWRFRDLYWLLRFRLCNERKKGRTAKMVGIRMLAGIHKGWFRLPGSDTLDELTLSQYDETLVQPGNEAKNTSSMVSKASNGDSDEASPVHLDGNNDDVQFGLAALPESDERTPLPVSKTPPPPLTGVRAPPTALWKMDFVIWCNVWNTFFQTCLCGFMWGLNRYKRPSWSTGFFIAIACIVAGVGGVMMFKEGKKVKRVEGVPVKTAQRIEDAEREVEGYEMNKKKGGRKDVVRPQREMENGGAETGGKGKAIEAGGERRN